MHRSRLAGFIIDCKTEDLERAAQFWSAALGYPLPEALDGGSKFIQLVTPPGDPQVIIQRVQHEPRAHLEAVRRARFLRSLHAIRRAEPSERTAAIDPGYTDYSHFVRDSHAFLGMSPQAFNDYFRKQYDGFVKTVRENNIKFE